MKKTMILLTSILGIVLLLVVCGLLLWSDGNWKEENTNIDMSFPIKDMNKLDLS